MPTTTTKAAAKPASTKAYPKPAHMGTGRRKSSVARVILQPGTGKITVNKREASAYFPYAILITDLKQPLTVTQNEAKFDIIANVHGGGFSGQAGAIRLGVARALLTVSEEYRVHLRDSELLTRDSRVVERKKYGLKGARRAPQFSKR